jgi:arsenate reductase-like glutaredoxin family protein
VNIDQEDIKLYGSEHCHKTQFYMDYFNSKKLNFNFLDVVSNPVHAAELRNLYTTGKLNFPTILIKGKKLRNPRIDEIEKWLEKKGID